MRRYAVIRLCFAVFLMEAWLLLTYLQPYGFWRFLPWAGCLWAIIPIHKVRSKRLIPISTRIAGWLAVICALGIFFWQSHLIDRDGLDIPTTFCFGLLFVAWGLQSWTWINEAPDQMIDEVFGSCVGAALLRNQNAESGRIGD